MTERNPFERLEQEMNNISTFAQYIIINPTMSTTPEEMDRIVSINLIRVKALKQWADAMEAQLKRSANKKSLKMLEELFESVSTEEVKTKNYGGA